MTEAIAGVSIPSVLVVPGAWHKPDHFRRLVDELSGIDVHTVTLTSSGDDPAAPGSKRHHGQGFGDCVEAMTPTTPFYNDDSLAGQLEGRSHG